MLSFNMCLCKTAYASLSTPTYPKCLHDAYAPSRTASATSQQFPFCINLIICKKERPSFGDTSQWQTHSKYPANDTAAGWLLTGKLITIIRGHLTSCTPHPKRSKWFAGCPLLWSLIRLFNLRGRPKVLDTHNRRACAESAFRQSAPRLRCPQQKRAPEWRSSCSANAGFVYIYIYILGVAAFSGTKPRRVVFQTIQVGWLVVSTHLNVLYIYIYIPGPSKGCLFIAP